MAAPPVGASNGSVGEVEKLDLASSRAAKKQHDQIIRWTNEKYQSIKNARTQQERQWYLNLAFYFGKQWVVPINAATGAVSSSVTTKLYTPPAPYYRSRPVINRIRPTIRHELSQLTSNKPSATVIPASAEDRDIYAAQAGEQLWEYEYREKKLKHVIRRAVWWELVCGNGFIKTYWDWNAGPKQEQMDPASGMPLVDPKTGQPAIAPIGDICYTPETPFHIMVPDFREEEIESQPYLIHAQVKSPEWVMMNFKEFFDKGIAPQSEANDVIEENFLNLIGTQGMNKQNSVLVKEVWIKPGSHPQFPEGAFFTVISDKIVQGFQGWPYTHGQYPFAKLDHIPSGKFYSTSSIEDLIPLQKEYNRTRGQIIEAKNRMAKPQLSAPRGSVDASKITTEPGQVIFYTPGFEAPKPIPLQALPAYVLQEIDRILLDWSDISGIHEVSQGQAPPGVTAATAISYLQERDESKLAPAFDSLEEGIEKVARQALVYIHDYWKEERMVKVTGPDGSFDVMTFKGSDLRGNLDLRIDGGSALPVSKAARQALLMDLMKMGFIDPKQGLEVMDMGGINKVYEQLQVDQRQAQRENLRMSKVTPEMMMQHEQLAMQQAQIEQMNEPPPEPEIDPITGELIQSESIEPPAIPLIIPVNTWDNHEAHIKYHNNFRKGQAFESLPEEVKVLFEEHVNAHLTALGLESVTMDPRMAAGLPPLPVEGEESNSNSGGESNTPPVGSPGSEQSQSNKSKTGPMPMPEMESGGM